MSKDLEFDTYLRGGTDVSRLYADAPQVEPPNHLDAAILAEAHRAAGSRPGAKPRRNWAVPLGMVASLFAVVMLGLQLPYMLKDAAMTQAPMAAGVPVATEREAAVAPSVSVAAEPGKVQSGSRAKAELMRNAPLAVDAYAKRDAAVAASPPAAMAVQPLAEADERAAAANGMAAAQAQKSTGVAAGRISDALEQRAPAKMTAPAPAQPDVAQAPPLMAKETEANLRPEEWLMRIQRLKQQGKLDEAKKEMAAFKKRYPDYRVPAAFEIR